MPSQSRAELPSTACLWPASSASRSSCWSASGRQRFLALAGCEDGAALAAAGAAALATGASDVPAAAPEGTRPSATPLELALG